MGVKLHVLDTMISRHDRCIALTYGDHYAIFISGKQKLRIAYYNPNNVNNPDEYVVDWVHTIVTPILDKDLSSNSIHCWRGDIYVLEYGMVKMVSVGKYEDWQCRD